MKLVLLLCLLTTTALAQRFNEPIRLINNQRVDVRPLITWWTNVVALNEANATRPETNQLPIPPRPLTAWALITTERMTNSGLVWIADVGIWERPESAPVQKLVVLEHVPLSGKQVFDRAATRDSQAQQELAAAESAKETHRQRAELHRARANTYYEFDYVAPGHGFFDEGVRHANAAQQEENRANAAERRESELRTEREQLNQITEGRSQFRLEAFALKTDRTRNGLPVYDVGLPFGR
jgi:hypothetical protein